MRLIAITEDGMPSYSPEAKVIKEFNAIIKRDKNRKKETATKELAFIHFWCIHDSRYSLFSNDNDKIDRIKDDLGLPRNWKPDQIIQAGIDKYTDLIKTRSYFLIEKASKALKQVEDFFADLNLSGEENKNNSGGLIIKPKDITDYYEKLPVLVKAEQEANKLVRSEYEEKINKLKDNIGLFEQKKFKLDDSRPIS